MSTNNSVELLQNILHNERAAEQTYSNLLSQLEEDSGALELVESFLTDHERASEFLTRLLDEQRVAESEPEASLWKDLNYLIETSPDPLQDPTAIKALQMGEERCRMDYEHAANSDVLDVQTARWIRAELLPSTEAHLAELSKSLEYLRAA